MPTKVSVIEALARQRLIEQSASFWSSDELVAIISAGIRDLWRDIVDMKAEHYLTVDNSNVTLPASSAILIGVPSDVHKVYLIEPRTTTQDGTSANLVFKPLDYNHSIFQNARATDPVDPNNNVLFYAITSQGAPVGPPVIYVAPKVTADVAISFCYVPTIGPITSDSAVPIPGEADNALIAWTVAYARAKEREDRSPDPAWISIYATDKTHLLESLGLRQYQEPKYVDGVFAEYW